jgi:hypothetical protein
MSDTNNEKTDWREREVGALWKKEGRNQKYLTGHVKGEDGEMTKLVIFSNKHKNAENQPDFRIYRSEDRAAQGDTVAGVASSNEDDTL